METEDSFCTSNDNLELLFKEKKKAFKPHAKFTQEEDELLRSLVLKKKKINWNEIANMMPGRNERQCRDRWTNYLSPTLNTSEWTSEEDSLLIEKVNQLGKKWVKISRFFNNRTDQMCKNRFNILERKKLCLKRGRKPGSKADTKYKNMPKNLPIATEFFFMPPELDILGNRLQDSYSEPDDLAFFTVLFE